MWIEIITLGVGSNPVEVTPFTGVWIEIKILSLKNAEEASHPSRVCGLKSYNTVLVFGTEKVTPFTGVWIEILLFLDESLI